MRYLSKIAIVWLLCTVSVCAQTVEPSSGVGKRTLQLEFESLYLMEKEGTEKVNSWSIPSVLMRYGVSDVVELQLNIPFLKEYTFEDENILSSRTFLDNIQAGVSVNLWEENGILPQAAVMARALIPIYNSQVDAIGSLVALNFSNTLAEQLSLNYNMGWIRDQGEDSGYYIANLSWNISSTVHTFVEFFGSTYYNLNMNHNINTGIGFNLGSSFCLDLSVASGLNHNMTFFGGVLSYQFGF